jgi:tetratricopeptide (TPR) repeat protein
MADPTIEQILAQAMEHHNAGHLREAEQGYRLILQRDPNNVDALNLLGVIAGTAGNAQAAAELIGRAVSLKPDDPDLLGNYATALRQAGRMNEAMEVFNRSVAIKEDPTVLMGMGDSYRQKQKFEQAAGCYRRAADLRPNDVAPIYALGSLLLSVHAIEQALPALQQAAALAPERAEIRRDLGIALLQFQRFEESADECGKALEKNPNDVLALSHRALALRRLGRSEEADQCFQRIIDLPVKGHAELFNRALALEHLDRFEEAVDVYQQSIKSNPSAVLVYINLGSLLQRMGQPTKAMEWFERAMKMAPQISLTHLDRAVVLLLQGNLAEGWKEYDWRWRCPERHPPMRPFPQPLWRDQDVAGKTVFLHSEQGLGDAVQFIRYAPMVQARGAKVIVEVQQELVALARTMQGIDQVIGRDDPLPPFDLHAPLMDLPMIFGTVLRNVPAEIPYFHSDPQKVQAWAQRLEQDEPNGRCKLRVGLVWAGRPSHPYDKSRSIKLAQYAPLAALAARVSFFSLQKGSGVDQLKDPPAGLALRDYTSDLHDFTDTAALLENLDLLITVDTSVAHVAGALGRPVWVLVGIAPDWRWLERRDDSPWYPTLRLFRQQKRLDWTKPIEKIASELRKMVEKTL